MISRAISMRLFFFMKYPFFACSAAGFSPRLQSSRLPRDLGVVMMMVVVMVVVVWMNDDNDLCLRCIRCQEKAEERSEPKLLHV